MQVLPLSEFQVLACQTALNKLFKSAYFDVCTLRDIAEVMGIQLGGDDYNALRLFHCIHYANMTPKVRRQVQDMTLKLLGVEIAMADVVEEVVEPKPASFARWLLGVKK